MRLSRRVTLGLLGALALHLGAHLLVERAAVRARPLAPTPPWSEASPVVELALLAPPRSAAPAPAPARASLLQAPAPPPPAAADPPASPAAPASPPLDAAPARVEPALPAGAPPAPARPRSLLERVLAGTTSGPLPSLELLDPARRQPPASDAERARRAIVALAAAAAARGAPPTDAGTTIDALEALEGGGYRYRTGGFVATIAVDGSVSFVDLDHREGLLSSGLPGRDPDNLLEPYGPAIEPRQRIDGAQVPRAMGLPLADTATTLGSGSFDPTAALLRAQGQDPYAPEKVCFLEETQSLRAELREAFEATQLAGLRMHLERLWFDEARPAVERRAALFAAWDECREETIGLRARELIESFVRQHLPRGSADEFSAQELAALNAHRASTAPFLPYG